MGPTYHAHGLEPNRRAVETFCQAAFDDGLTRRRVTVNEFFGEYLQAGERAASERPESNRLTACAQRSKVASVRAEEEGRPKLWPQRD